MESKSYISSPLHGLVGQLGVAMGIPDSCVTEVKCVDCGKIEMAAHCSWTFNLETHKHSGPHCGCRSV